METLRLANMKTRYLGIPLMIASAVFLSACTGGNDNHPDTSSTPSQSESSSVKVPNPKESKPVDPNDPNQGRNIDTAPTPDFTAPAGSMYDMNESGKGVDKDKDAGDSVNASELSAPIKSGGIGTSAGVAILFNGSGFTANSPVSIKITTLTGEDTGVEVEPANSDASGNLTARVYLPANLQSGTYEITFSGAGEMQKSKVDIMALQK